MGFSAKNVGRAVGENRCLANFIILGIALLAVRSATIYLGGSIYASRIPYVSEFSGASSADELLNNLSSASEFFGNLLFLVALGPLTYHIIALMQIYFVNLEERASRMLFDYARISYVFYAITIIFAQAILAILALPAGCADSAECYLEAGAMLKGGIVVSMFGYLLFAAVLGRTMVGYDGEIVRALHRRYKAKLGDMGKTGDIKGLLEIVYCHASFTSREFPEGIKNINKQFEEEYRYHSRREKREDLAKVKAYSKRIVEKFEDLRLEELAIDRKKVAKKGYGDLLGKKNIPELIAKYCSVGSAALGLAYLILQIPEHLPGLSKLWGG